MTDAQADYNLRQVGKITFGPVVEETVGRDLRKKELETEDPADLMLTEEIRMTGITKSNYDIRNGDIYINKRPLSQEAVLLRLVALERIASFANEVTIDINYYYGDDYRGSKSTLEELNNALLPFKFKSKEQLKEEFDRSLDAFIGFHKPYGGDEGLGLMRNLIRAKKAMESGDQ